MLDAEPKLAGRTEDFGTAFPNVLAIDLTVDDNPWGWYDVRGDRPLRFRVVTATSSIACPNDKCRRRGFDFGGFLRNYTFGSSLTSVDESFPCNGDEGSASGRQVGTPCMNTFKIKGTISYKKEEG